MTAVSCGEVHCLVNTTHLNCIIFGRWTLQPVVSFVFWRTVVNSPLFLSATNKANTQWNTELVPSFFLLLNQFMWGKITSIHVSGNRGVPRPKTVYSTRMSPQWPQRKTLLKKQNNKLFVLNPLLYMPCHECWHSNLGHVATKMPVTSFGTILI